MWHASLRDEWITHVSGHVSQAAAVHVTMSRLPGQTLLPSSANADQERVTSRLTHHAGNSAERTEVSQEVGVVGWGHGGMSRGRGASGVAPVSGGSPGYVFNGVHEEYQLHFFRRVHVVVVKILGKDRSWRNLYS